MYLSIWMNEYHFVFVKKKNEKVTTIIHPIIYGINILFFIFLKHVQAHIFHCDDVFKQIQQSSSGSNQKTICNSNNDD